MRFSVTCLLLALSISRVRSQEWRALKKEKKGKGIKKKSKKKSKGEEEPPQQQPLVEERELCVIGGGAAGAYTAYEAQKRGYDTVVFEPKSELGGNCEILSVPSTLDQGVSSYNVTAAVVIFSPTETVTSFFAEMGGTPPVPFQTPENRFVFGSFGTAPVPPQSNPMAIGAALAEYTSIVSAPPYNSVFENPLITVPDFERLTEEQTGLLLEPFGAFLQKHPGVQPLVPIIAAYAQGFGYFPELQMWEVLAAVPAVYLGQALSGTFLTLPDGCQDVYNRLEAKMLAKDPTSVKLDTGVDRITRTNDGAVLLDTNSDDDQKTYRCKDAIVAFRPDGLDETTLNPISENEKEFFADLSYNGYVPSVWKMDPGPTMEAIGALPNLPFSFSAASLVDVGIYSIGKDGPQTDYPYRVFYEPAGPADTPEKLADVRDAIAAELATVGFVNIENVWIKNHKYGVRPTSTENLKAWASFFRDANYNDDDHLYWTGSAVSTEHSERVWEYSKELLDAKFPAKVA